MSPEGQANRRKLPVLKLVAVGIVLLAVAVLGLRGVDFRALGTDMMALIREAGPALFFSAMMILPALGMPLAAFTISAGEAFSEQLGMPVVIALCLAAIAINLSFGYWLSRHAFRPLLSRLLSRYGYSVPRVTPDNALSILLLVRLTPGPPYVVQTWTLGIAEAPFRLYMIVSWLAILPWALGGIILGQGLFDGNLGAVMIGLGVLVVAGVGVQLLRKKFFRRES